MTDLIDQYRTLHREGKFLGLSVVKFADEIGELCKQYDCRTMLDYGAGQGRQYAQPHKLHRKWEVELTCYDPAVEGMDKLPSGKFDAVICCDVLEHILEEDIEETLREIFWRADKFVFLTVCCRPAKKTLPDGRNVHVTIKPMAWWEDKIAAVARYRSIPPMPVYVRETP